MAKPLAQMPYQTLGDLELTFSPLESVQNYRRDLDLSRRGPVVIKERVRAIGGNLTVDSAPGRGARLEIAIPSGETLPR